MSVPKGVPRGDFNKNSKEFKAILKGYKKFLKDDFMKQARQAVNEKIMEMTKDISSIKVTDKNITFIGKNGLEIIIVKP